jgi:hypothetical protein
MEECKTHGKAYLTIRKSTGRVQCKECIKLHPSRRPGQRVEEAKRRYELFKPQIDAQIREYKLTLRISVLTHYSQGTPTCAKCFVTDLRFLALDHIQNDGASHRRETGGKFYFWAKKHGFPPIFQVLCHNCNFLKYLSTIQRNETRDVIYKRKLKNEVMSAYSNGAIKCDLCSVDNIDVLTIDHIHGGGTKHIKQLEQKGTFLYRELRKLGYPDGYRVLCFNHNLGLMCTG